MPTYTTPGVYVEEISTFPPSVAEVSTAIPAFLGQTEKGPLLAPTRIDTLLAYEQTFGGPPDIVTGVAVATDGSVQPTVKGDAPILYYSLRLYFDNGGGPCYVVSVGNYSATPTTDDFRKGLDSLRREDEPTLIVMPDAIRLADDDFGLACAAALDHCGLMRDRFALLDVKPAATAQETVPQNAERFRGKVASDYLSYGAAYAPFLVTGLSPAFREELVAVTGISSSSPAADNAPVVFEGTVGGLRLTYTGSATAQPKVAVLASQRKFEIALDPANPVLTIKLDTATEKAGSLVKTEWAKITDPRGFTLDIGDTENATPAAETILARRPTSTTSTPVTLRGLKGAQTDVYNRIKTAIGRRRLTLPPSAAMAGIYARVDRDRGVWKAPANVAVASVVSLGRTYTDAEQGLLNVDPTSGKSINVIRSFTGRGPIVWGARTLAGNDNEWRYVPVRRLFIMIEESTQKATAFAVFEPNTATTWLKVKAMIESYLYGLWERGALAGAAPEAAYFVNVGLGTTMTAQDILEGRMIVEIGIAAVRPAEFIILRFSHKMQES